MCSLQRSSTIYFKKLDIPTIGIGSGADCDGQVLVIQDLTGVFRDFTPRHVKKYLDMGSAMEEAVGNYIDEVQRGLFPTEKNSFVVDDKVIDDLEKLNFNI